MEELLVGLNWTAVVVSFVAAFGLGWLWYSDLFFGKRWRDGIGIAFDDNTPMAPAMIAQMIGTFLFAWLIGITAITDSLLTAMLIAVTFATFIVANGLFSQKRTYAILVEASYIIAMVLVMIVVHILI